MILFLTDLVEACTLPENTALFCGALAAIGGVRPAGEFRMELVDPVLERKIQTSYRIESLPIIA